MEKLKYALFFFIIQIFIFNCVADTTTLSGFPDTYIVIETDSTPYSSPTLIVEGYHCSACIDERALIRFDLSALRRGVTITSAKLTLYSPSQPRPGAGTIRAYKMTRDWEPSEANWYNATKSTKWSKAGGDFSSTPVASLTYSLAVNVWHTLDVTTAVRDFAADSSANFGLMLKLDASMYTVTYVSSKGAVASQHPKLEIVYSGSAIRMSPRNASPEASPYLYVAGSRMIISFPNGGVGNLFIGRLDGEVLFNREITEPIFSFGLPGTASGRYVIRSSGQNGQFQKMITLTH